MANNDDIVCRGSYALGSACQQCSRCREELDAMLLHGKAYEVAQRMAETFAEYLGAEEDACRIDHNGFCQSHTSGPPCIVAEARAALEEWDEVTQ